LKGIADLYNGTMKITTDNFAFFAFCIQQAQNLLGLGVDVG
jgi:hypothetical protein